MASSSSAAESAQGHGLKNGLAWWGGAALLLLLSWYVGEIQREALLDELELQARQELDLYVSHLEISVCRVC